MFKIKDRMTLGIIAGLIGNLAKTLIDEISLRKKISKRSFRGTAAGVWVNKKSEATSIKGQILGGLLDFGLGSLSGVGTVYMLSKTGKDRLITKGIISGVAMGSLVTFIVGAIPENKIRPKDAASSLSYMASHAFFGIITTVVAAHLGHYSLFDAEPENDYLEPTIPTSGQIKTKAIPVRFAKTK